MVPEGGGGGAHEHMPVRGGDVFKCPLCLGRTENFVLARKNLFIYLGCNLRGGCWGAAAWHGRPAFDVIVIMPPFPIPREAP